MKRLALTLTLLFLILSFSSCKKMSDKMTVVKNCTGIYLVNHGNSYRVCNYNLLNAYQDGDKVNLKVKKIESCSIEYPLSNCMLVYSSKGMVEILKIK